MLAIVAHAVEDLLRGIRMRRVWMALAAEDIGDQHKRTTLGPLWLLLNYLAFAGTFIFIFDRGGGGGQGYGVFVATGLLVFFYITEVMTSSVTLFAREESFIKGTTLPLSVYVMRAALQAMIRAGYALIGCLAILAATGTWPALPWLASVAGIILILAVTPAVVTCCAFLGVFFPDSQYIVSNLMRVMMFMSPVFWRASDGMTGLQAAFYYYNPFTWFLDIVRQPIVEGTMPWGAFGLCLGIGAGLWVLALVLLGAFRRQVALVL